MNQSQSIISELNEASLFFVLYQSGIVIFGLGRTDKAARKDASSELSGGKQDADKAKSVGSSDLREIDGNLYVRQATKRLYDAALDDPQVRYTINDDGVLDLDR